MVLPTASSSSVIARVFLWQMAHHRNAAGVVGDRAKSIEQMMIPAIDNIDITAMGFRKGRRVKLSRIAMPMKPTGSAVACCPGEAAMMLVAWPVSDAYAIFRTADSALGVIICDRDYHRVMTIRRPTRK